MPFVEARKPFLGLCFALIVNLVAALPELAFSINSQVPPIAYASQPYSFAFSNTTFVSTAPQISYAITNGPAWLNLDSTHRLFSGTPNRSDLGSATFQLVASDNTGQSSTSVTFVVLESASVGLNAPILPHLQLAGPASAPKSLLLHPLQSFRFNFSENTFRDVTPDTRYYAVSVDNTPLPSWIQFEPTHLLFSGTSPPLVSPLSTPQTYGVRLSASNVPGFAEVAIEFNIIVGQHVLAFSLPSQDIDIANGKPFQTPPLRSSLSLDGQTVADKQISSISLDGPDWIRLDKTNLSLSGVPTESFNTSVTISVSDIYNDVANTTVCLKSSGSVVDSLGTIAGFSATIGQYFSFTLNIPTFSPSIEATPDLGSASSWLDFDAKSWTLSGQPPQNLSPKTLSVSITFENSTTRTTGIVRLQLLEQSTTALASSANLQETRSAPLASDTNGSTDSAMSTTHLSSSTRHVLVITLVTFLSFLGVLLACLVVFFLLKRRRKQEDICECSEVEATLSGGHESQLPGDLGTLPEMPEPAASPQMLPPARPPRIDLRWSSDSLQQSTHRLSGVASSARHRNSKNYSGETGAVPVTDQSHQTDGLDGAADSNVQPPIVENRQSTQRRSLRLPHRASDSEHCGQERNSVATNRQTALFLPLGLAQRRSGVGHGAGILTHPEAALNRTSWRSTWLSNPLHNSKRSTVVLESFPVPPSDGLQQLQTTSSGKIIIPSVRIGSGESGQSMSFEARRQKWHTERARARLEGSFRFSNAGSSSLIPPRRLRLGRVNNSTGDYLLPTAAAFDDMKGEEHDTSRQPSWSKWSDNGLEGRNSPGVGEILDAYGGKALNSKTNPSIASSRQFESVASSSDSHWEDENLTTEEVEKENRLWQIEKGSQASPRLPLSAYSNSGENMRSIRALADAQQTRRADKSKHVSLQEGGGLPSSQGSQRGSFRFI